ncbi:MAG: SDR family NAD(P)-dependent oxidoreductase [Candidatus Shapirobacteria bacterium]
MNINTAMAGLYRKPIVLITGAASGIGREIAARLHLTCRLCLFDFNARTLPLVAAKFKALHYLVNVADSVSVDTAVSSIIAKTGHIDVVINCAGVYLDGPVTDNPPASIKNTLLVNTLGPINICQSVLPYLKKRKSGLIINLNSAAALRPRSECSVYHASKYALNGFSQSLAAEVEPFGIRVTQLFPDIVNTGFSKKGNIKRNFRHSLDPSAIADLVSYLVKLPPHLTLPEITLRYY